MTVSKKKLAALLQLEADVDAAKKKRADYNARRNARRHILIEKAVAAGIVVSDEEVDARLAE